MNRSVLPNTAWPAWTDQDSMSPSLHYNTCLRILLQFPALSISDLLIRFRIRQKQVANSRFSLRCRASQGTALANLTMITGTSKIPSIAVRKRAGFAVKNIRLLERFCRCRKVIKAAAGKTQKRCPAAIFLKGTANKSKTPGTAQRKNLS